MPVTGAFLGLGFEEIGLVTWPVTSAYDIKHQEVQRCKVTGFKVNNNYLAVYSALYGKGVFLLNDHVYL